MKHQCDNCDLITESPPTAKDLALRLDEGGPTPSGECPECGALVYPLTLFSSVKEEAMKGIRNAAYKAADAALVEIRKRSATILNNLADSAKDYLNRKMK